MSAEILCWIVLVICVASIALTAVAGLRGYDIDPIAAFADIGGFIFSSLWAVYFGRADVRNAFAVAASIRHSKTA